MHHELFWQANLLTPGSLMIVREERAKEDSGGAVASTFRPWCRGSRGHQVHDFVFTVRGLLCLEAG